MKADNCIKQKEFDIPQYYPKICKDNEPGHIEEFAPHFCTKDVACEMPIFSLFHGRIENSFQAPLFSANNEKIIPEVKTEGFPKFLSAGPSHRHESPCDDINTPFQKIAPNQNQENVLNLDHSFNVGQIQTSEKTSNPPKNRKGRKKGFTEEEEIKMKALVEKYGEKNWATIAKYMPGKNRKQIREHYLYFIKVKWELYFKKLKEVNLEYNYIIYVIIIPIKVNYRDFTEDEKQLIIETIRKKGRVWSELANMFPGKNPIMIKNFYNTKLKHRMHGQNAQYKTENNVENDQKSKFKEDILESPIRPIPVKRFLSVEHKKDYELFMARSPYLAQG